MAAKKLYYSNINISIIYVMKVYLSLKSKQYSFLYFDVDRKRCVEEIVSAS